MSKFDLSRFDLNLLVLMNVLMEERHVGRAASRLSLSPSAISHALARLRLALDDPLFIRNPRGIEPTPLAKELAPQVVGVLATVREIVTARRPFNPATMQRTVTVGATDYAVLTTLAPTWPKIQAAAPGLTLRVAPVDRTSFAAGLDSGELDLVIGSFDRPPQRVNTTPLFTERFVGICRKNHPCLQNGPHGDTISMHDFIATPHALISPAGELRGIVDIELEKLGLSRRIAVACPHFLAVPFLVGNSDLIAVAAERAMTRLAGTAGLVLFELPLELPSWVVSIGYALGRIDEPETAWLAMMLQHACSDADASTSAGA
jgi:DNA-binding transcriptional LysR family regulator